MGNVYGRLTVIKRAAKNNKGWAWWECQCECGNKMVAAGAYLRNGTTKSCGCLVSRKSPPNLKNEMGNKYGRLTVIERAGQTKQEEAAWLCRCQCGKELVVSGQNLRSGNTKSCGCLHDEMASLPYGQAAFNTLWSRYEKDARKRGKSWGLSRVQFRELTQGNCHYCGSPPAQVTGRTRGTGKYIYNGIDRIDNEEGYTEGNVVPCCGVCNRMKMGDSIDEFLSQIRRMYKHWAGRQGSAG